MLATSSLSAGALNSAQRQSTIGARLRQLLAALFFDLGLCYSGRHRHRDRTLRAGCCNGFRCSWNVGVQEDFSGRVYSMRRLELRPLTFADPRFPWEMELELLPEFHASVHKRRRSGPVRHLGELHHFGPPIARPFCVPPLADGTPDYSTEQRLSRLKLSLSLADAHCMRRGYSL